MKTSLASLLKQITPLPWKWDGSNLMSGEGNVACNPRSGSSKEWVQQGELSLRYAEHAANQLPNLIAALHDCAMSMERLDDKEDAYRVTCLQQARQALADAQEVEL